MKLKFLATGQSPINYTVDGETIIADGESFDLSAIEHGDKYAGAEPEILTLPGSQIIRDAFRDEHSELHVTLCQKAQAGEWRESDWIDTSEYVPGRRYIKQLVNGVLIDPTWPEDLDEQD